VRCVDLLTEGKQYGLVFVVVNEIGFGLVVSQCDARDDRRLKVFAARIASDVSEPGGSYIDVANRSAVSHVGNDGGLIIAQLRDVNGGGGGGGTGGGSG
jgi:hypothetical protein